MGEAPTRLWPFKPLVAGSSPAALITPPVMAKKQLFLGNYPLKSGFFVVYSPPGGIWFKIHIQWLNSEQVLWTYLGDHCQQESTIVNMGSNSHI
jgi:hypothetical protein